MTNIKSLFKKWLETYRNIWYIKKRYIIKIEKGNIYELQLLWQQ